MINYLENSIYKRILSIVIILIIFISFYILIGVKDNLILLIVIVVSILTIKNVTFNTKQTIYTEKKSNIYNNE